MLYLYPHNGVFYVKHSRFPDGHLAAFCHEDAARIYIQWIHDMHFDIAGLLSRLYFDRLTAADRRLIRYLDYAARHETRVVSRLEPLADKLARLRAQAVPET